MADIKIVVDTSSDIPNEVAEKYNIGILSFLSLFGEECYTTGVNMTNREFYEKLESSSEIPTTAQTPYGDMYDYLLEQAEKHDTVIYFSISSAGSGQYNTATLVANEIKEEKPNLDIRIVDTHTYSLYIAQTAVYASELLKQGKSADEIINECKKYTESWRCYLLVDTLKYLEKGGRINKAKAIMGTLLDIKPILSVSDGLVEMFDKLRGKKKLLEKLIEKMIDDPDFDSDKKEFLVLHSDSDKGEKLCQLLKEEFDIDKVTMFSEFGPIIGTHVGPGAVAVVFRIKEEK